MEAGNLERAAQALGAARLDNVAVPDLPEEIRPQSEDEGYAVQAALAGWFREHGQGEPVGYKVGATTAGMQSYLGVAGPAFGRIMSDNLHASPAVLPREGFLNPGIECEVAIRLGDDVPASDHLWTRDDVVALIDAVMPAIEIVENRYGDFLSRGIGTLVADDFFHKACVVGAPIAEWPNLDLDRIAGRTLIDGAVAGTGRGADVMGHPLEAVAWLANTLAGQGRSLEAGEIVLTGSMTPVHWIDRLPCKAEVEFEGLGSCAVELA